MFTLLIVVIVIALLFDLVNGFHDAANSIATVVSTKVLTPFQAVVWAATFNILAFWVFDMSVGNTVAKTVDSSAIDLWVILAGLLAAMTWNLLTWWLGIPSSSSHTLIGGFAGAAVAHAGFDVIESSVIIKVILFIFLAPLIGGIIAFLIAVITIMRNFWLRMFWILVLSGITFYAMLYLIEFNDMKPIMMYIIMGLLLLFVLVYLLYYLKNKNKPSAVREASMYKRLQLLSSAAFSLGHGGADSQKVMGIICAALLVYGNIGREEGWANDIPESLRVTELIQVEYHSEDGKKHNYKPNVCEIDGEVFHLREGSVFNGSGQKIYDDNGTKITSTSVPDLETMQSSFQHIAVYRKENTICDAKSNQIIFDGTALNHTYKYASAFEFLMTEDGTALTNGKIKTKVRSETMPFWIAFGCYFMIGLGTLMGGWKIVKTMGTKITKVTPLEGVCAETSGALTLFTVSQFGIPVSTTHTITGSIIGVGATKRLSAVRWGVTLNLLWAWILTIPVSMVLAGIFYYLIVLIK